MDMDDFKRTVINWSASLGREPSDDETMRSLCNPQIQPIIEWMMRNIRPVEEVQMVRRQVAMSKLKKKSDAGETKPEDEERVALLRKYKVLKTELEEKAARQLAEKEKIETLKREIEQKRRKASSLEHVIYELNRQTFIVTAVSQKLVTKLKRLCDSNRVAFYCKNFTQEQQSPPSETMDEVNRFTAEQEKIIKSLKTYHISAPPALTPDVDWHAELIELEIYNIEMKKQLEECNSMLAVAVDGLVQCTMRSLPDSVNKEIVQEWAKLLVMRKKSETVYNYLKEVISARSNSLCADRDYLRLVLIDAEKTLNTRNESYKSLQKEVLKLAKDLSHSWQRIEEAAEQARRKHSQLQMESKEARACLSESTDTLRLAVAVELQALHETMISLMERDPPVQEVLDFGTTYNDLYYVLKLMAQKRTAKHGILSLPEIFTPTEDVHWDELFRTNSRETDNSEKYKKFSNMGEVNGHMDALLSNSDRLIQALHDLVTVWWQPPFETAVPEDLVVNGKNILQHTAHWDRVTTFLSKSS